MSKGPATKELQLPPLGFFPHFPSGKVVKFMDSDGLVEIFEFLCPTASLMTLMTLMTIGFDAFAKDHDLPLGSNSARLNFFGEARGHELSQSTQLSQLSKVD